MLPTNISRADTEKMEQAWFLRLQSLSPELMIQITSRDIMTTHLEESPDSEHSLTLEWISLELVDSYSVEILKQSSNVRDALAVKCLHWPRVGPNVSSSSKIL